MSYDSILALSEAYILKEVAEVFATICSNLHVMLPWQYTVPVA